MEGECLYLFLKPFSEIDSFNLTVTMLMSSRSFSSNIKMFNVLSL